MADDAKSGVIQRLLTVAGVTDLVGDRIDPRLAPQGDAYPRIGVGLISVNRIYPHEGKTALVGGALLQVNCYARTETAVKALAKQVRLALHGYMGAAGDLSAASITLENERDADEPVSDGSEQTVYAVQQDYEVWHDEDTA